MNSVFSWKRTFESVFMARSSPPGLCDVNKLAGNLFPERSAHIPPTDLSVEWGIIRDVRKHISILLEQPSAKVYCMIFQNCFYNLSLILSLSFQIQELVRLNCLWCASLISFLSTGCSCWPFPPLQRIEQVVLWHWSEISNKNDCHPRHNARFTGCLNRCLWTKGPGHDDCVTRAWDF